MRTYKLLKTMFFQLKQIKYLPRLSFLQKPESNIGFIPQHPILLSAEANITVRQTVQVNLPSITLDECDGPPHQHCGPAYGTMN